jgi:WD40 repeat protein
VDQSELLSISLRSAYVKLSFQVFDDRLAAFAQDARQFVVNFYIPISSSTPHIYVSALSFAPAESCIAKHYQPQFPSTISVVSGGVRDWTGLCHTFRGHTGTVFCVVFSPDGNQIVSASSDHTMRIWDVTVGELVVGPIEHPCGVDCVAFSPDGRRVISGGGDATIRVWDAATGELVAGPLRGHIWSIHSVAFMPDGHRVVSAAADGARIWDAGTLKPVASPTSPIGDDRATAHCAAASPEGNGIVLGSEWAYINIWNAGATCEHIAGPIKGHAGPISAVAYSPDGKRVVSGSKDCTLRIWDSLSGELVAGPIKGHSGWVSSVAFSPDGKRVVSGSFDRTVRIWDSVTGELVGGPYEGHISYVFSVAFSPSGKCVVSSSADHTIRLWDVGMDQAIVGPNGGKTTLNSSITLAQNCQRSVSECCDRDAMASVLDSMTRQVVALGAHTDIVLSPAGPDLHSSSRDITLRIRDDKPGPFNACYGFLGEDSIREGWVHCLHLRGNDSSDRGYLFWVPETCRQALCGTEMLAVACKYTTRLDLSRFVHGTSWTQCYSFRVSHYK